MSKNPFANIPSYDAADLFAFLDNTLKARKVPMIYGAPGIGKSSILAQWAALNKYALLDIRLAQMLPEHIAAIQYVSADHKSAVALTPAIIGQVAALEKQTGKPVLILFDELTLASQETLSAALEIILDRRVSGFKLPDSCLIAAAGNRPQDTSSAMLLDPPVKSRLFSCVYQPSPQDTADYIAETFKDSPFAAAVADFVTSTQAKPLLTNDVPTDDAALVTPRGIVAAIEVAIAAGADASQDFAKQRPLRMAFECSVGRAFFSSLASYALVAQTTKTPDEILAAPGSAVVPEVLQAATAQFSAVIAHVSKIKDDNKRAAATQSMLTYLERCSVDHLRTWAASLSPKISELLTGTVRGKRLLHDAGISLETGNAADIAAAARSK